LPDSYQQLKGLKKILFYLAAVVLTAALALIASAFLFSDQLVAAFIRQANTRLNTRITVGHTRVNVFRHFPSIAIEFSNVYVEDTHPGQYPLLTAGRVAFTFNPIQVLRGNYSVKGIILTETEVNLKINQQGEENYNLFSPASDSASGAVQFALSNIYLYNCRVRYVHLARADELVFYTDRLTASLQSDGLQYTIHSRGQVAVEKFSTGATTWPTPAALLLDAELSYDDARKKLTIQPSALAWHQTNFEVQGSYTWADVNHLNLTVNAKNAGLPNLIALLPQPYQQNLARYRSSGHVYFSLNLKGSIEKNNSPSLEAQFGLEQGRMYHPDLRAELDNLSLNGHVLIGNLRKPETATITLNNITGTLNRNAFSSKLKLKNPNDPDIQLDFNGQLDAAAVLELFPVKKIKAASGSLTANLSFEGKTSWLKDKNTVQKISALGSIDLHQLNIQFQQPEMQLANLGGTLQFNRNDLALSNVSGLLGESDFRLNGFFKNIFTWLLFENQPLGIEADLQARYLNLAQLFGYAFGGAGTDQQQTFTFSISPLVNLKFVADVHALRFNRFYARNVKGDLSVSGQVALSKNISFTGLGGNVLLTGSLNARNPRVIEAGGALLLDGVHLDSAFYVFNNFGQTFIEARHLKGQAYAEVMMDMKLKPDLTLFAETLTADITATIKNGELNHFEPLQKLSRYIGDANLSALRFADLKNDIHIERSTVYIPQMEVVSSATVMQISGTHRFDQQIDYRIVVPLQNNRTVNLEEAAGAIEELEGRPKLFLKITGTTSNYSVQYDTDAVKRKIVTDLKREVQELKSLFKKKQQKKEAQLSKEEFDW
jgi:hypothetical protein